jgi:hypothetical protein
MRAPQPWRSNTLMISVRTPTHQPSSSHSEWNENETHGLDYCVYRCLSRASIPCLRRTRYRFCPLHGYRAGLSKTSSGQIVLKSAGLPSQTRAVQERQISLTPNGWKRLVPSCTTIPPVEIIPCSQLPLSASLAGPPRWPARYRPHARPLSPIGYLPLADPLSPSGPPAVIRPRNF